MVNVAWVIALAVALDLLLGEPRRAHPLVAFGRWARYVEARLHADRRLAGVLAWCVTVLPLSALAWWLVHLASTYSPWAAVAVEAVLLYLAVGLQSLGAHAAPVINALREGRLDAAREAVGRIVSRDTAPLDQTQVAVAATESVLENGNDAVFGALFWFVLLGAPGAVAYRLANTLDAMWGYRTARYFHFGWAAARMDDVLNYIPARLTASTYALCGRTRLALRCWRRQAPRWDSPNAGPVMAAGAGALGARLGGPAPYRGEWTTRPDLGAGEPPSAETIAAALRLVRLGVLLWWLVIATATIVFRMWNHA